MFKKALISLACVFYFIYKQYLRCRLMYCGVADEGCAALASVMKSNTTDLKELYLDKNELGDSGVELLSDALENPRCKLELLK